MTASKRARPVPVGAEIALAFAGGAAAFTLVAGALALIDSDVLVVVLGAGCVAAVVAMARSWGAAYAVPAAMAGLLAYDWFQIPPTHPWEFPDSTNLAHLLVYLAVAALVGELAAHAGRRADVTEVARGHLADEQAALRRVATLVAAQAPPDEVFAAVAREVGQLLDVDATHMARYDQDDTATAVGSWSRADDQLPVGTRADVTGENVSSLVRRTGRPARMDRYDDDPATPAGRLRRELGIRSSVAAPIIVDGSLWGVMSASSKSVEPLPADTESRIAAFTELVATAISNTEARSEVQRLADEQAALRRVATLVARGVPAAAIFSAVAEELEWLFAAQATLIGRLDPHGTMTIVASRGRASDEMPVGTHLKLESGMVLARVVRTGRSARVDDYGHASGFLDQVTRRTGVRCSVAVPIMVEGALWGAMGAGTTGEPFPAEAEPRMAEFTELVATAVSNIQAREDLAASRARIVAAADEERRRVVRDLHDGAQQRLVHSIITLKLAHRALEPDQEPASELVAEALGHAERANVELRELAHGILPAVLTHGGLRAGVEALASRMPVPVESDVSVDRLPSAVEATAYFVVAEALTNVAKHSHAGRAAVTARIEDGTLAVQVRDDGVGGARPDGSGLLGLGDRLAALDGQLRVESPADGGTLVAAEIPLAAGILRAP